MSKAEDRSDWVTHSGNCHCKAVSYKFVAPTKIVAGPCTCSICDMKGTIHYTISADQLTSFEGKEHLSNYTFNTKTAQHWFCKHCGVVPLYIPRTKPDGYSINMRTVDEETKKNMTLKDAWDGENWEEANARDKGKEPRSQE